jgi:hypothetical protein
VDCYDELEALRAELEREVRRILLSMFGSDLRSKLPQRWLFSTKTGDATLTINEDGGVDLSGARARDPDVTVRGTDRFICVALGIRMGPDGRPYDLRPVFHTERGEAAFRKLMRRIGL